MKNEVRAYEGNKPYIFVSYAHLDSDAVLPVIRALYERKYRVWYDEGIAPGSEWPENIERHLDGADTVLVFVSAHSLDSRNCENEVRAAAGMRPEAQNRRSDTSAKQSPDAHGKKIVTISLDGAVLASGIPVQAALPYDGGHAIDALSDGETLARELIGDGVSGYAYKIGKSKHFNIWNLLLGLAAVLICGLFVALYGIYTGWFDELLPAKQTVVEQAEPTAQPQVESVSIGETMIGDVLPVTFSSNVERDAVYEALGWAGTSEMTYRDLNGMDQVTQLDLTGRDILDLSFAAYLPNLELLTLFETPVVDLTPLGGCPKLKTVQITANMLPLSVAADRTFELEVL